MHSLAFILIEMLIRLFLRLHYYYDIIYQHKFAFKKATNPQEMYRHTDISTLKYKKICANNEIFFRKLFIPKYIFTPVFFVFFNC